MSRPDVPARWVVRDGIVVEADGGGMICSPSADLVHWRVNAALLAGAPQLLEAARAARDAIDEAGQHLPLDSTADTLASKAFGLLIDAILVAETVHSPQPGEKS